MKIKQLIHRYKHAWVLLYGFIYLPWFMWLEKTVTKDFYVIHSSIDDYIPFVEYFIIPYLLWFIYIAATGIYFFFKDTAGFYRLAAFLVIGMTAFLVISTLFHNGLDMRPETFARDNIFVNLVKLLHTADTSTNVLPSIHVYNSIGAYLAISHSKTLRQNKITHIGSLVLSILIILSTMFLKQHSIIDVVAAIALSTITYLIVYARQPKPSAQLSRQPAFKW